MAARFAPTVDAVLDAAGVPPGRRAAVGEALLRERLGAFRVTIGWVLRPRAGAPLLRELRATGVVRRLALLLVVHAVSYVLFLASWWVVGRGALQGRFEAGWLAAWALLLGTGVPLRAAALALQGNVAIGAGTALKRRLLAGALRLPQDEVRSEGAGMLLGRVAESATVESLAVQGGLAVLPSLIELALGAAVLVAGAGGGLQAAALGAWLVLTGLVAWRQTRRRLAWTRERIALTRDLVEVMVGNRTRVAQQPPGRWHEREDAAMARYLEAARPMDQDAARIAGGVYRGWLLLGVAALLPAFLSGQEPAALAVGVGGVLLTGRALQSLVGGLSALLEAGIAWGQVRALYDAAARRPEPGAAAALDASPDEARVVEARGLIFRHAGRPDPVLRGADLVVEQGDRLLLEGPSGGGKSTLVAVLAGLRTPQSGLLLAGGLDRPTLGEDGWRRRVVVAPQFHENHVLADTFAFNVLLGRGWPPTQADMNEADAVCRALGLGELLDRMPSGLMQIVGESGWQLSHGERSRLFIARALLQRPTLLVLDESFAALDPANLRRAMECVLERAPALLVVAHP
jgi:ATP-binding cassette subfamily B protein